MSTTGDYRLAHGTHASPADGRCAMEWVAHLAGEPHSDAPECVSPVLRVVCVALNDGLPDGPRQRLRPYLTRTIGTAGDGLDPVRGWAAVDWLVRGYAPAWLALAGSADAAGTLRRGRRIDGPQGLAAILEELRDARRELRSLRGAAFGAGGLRVGARLSAARAARDGREAAWTCAGDAAWAAARLVVDSRDGERARRLLRELSGDAAAIALARVEADDVCGAPSGLAARRAALGPTLEALVDAAIALLDAMLPTVALPAPHPPADDGAAPARVLVRA